jgi:hypothetical protein
MLQIAVSRIARLREHGGCKPRSGSTFRVSDKPANMSPAAGTDLENRNYENL